MDLVYTYQGHTQKVCSVCVTSNNKYLVSGSFDNTVRITRLDTGELVRVIKGHTDHGASVSVTSDNSYVITSLWDKTVRITRLDTGPTFDSYIGSRYSTG